MVLVRFLLHAGHIKLGGSEVDFEFGMVLKVMAMSDLRESGCLFSGDDAGHKGDNFGGLASFPLLVDGVSEGTQNEGNVGFAAWTILVER